MKSVLLIGDSIRVGYDKAVKKSLEGVAEVCFPAENCRFAAYVLRYVHEYAQLVENNMPDVIHWNAGLWDCLRMFGEEPHTPKEIYGYYIERICQRIKNLYPDAKVIFATSTAVISDKMSAAFKRYNEEIEEYNKIAVEIVAKYGFKVNDLYAVSAKLPESAHSDATHYYTPAGTEAFTNKVLEVLAEALELDTVPVYKEELHTNKPVGV